MAAVPRMERKKQGREDHDDEEHDWRQRLKIIRGGFGERVVQGDVAGHVIVDAGMACPGVAEERFEMLGDLGHSLVTVLGENEIDHHPGCTSVTGNQPPDDLDCIQSNRLNAGQIGVAQHTGVLDEWGDD